MNQEASVQARPGEPTRSDSIAKLCQALSKAQGSFPTIPKNRVAEVTMKSGGKYSYNYADLADIISATKGPLSENGLAQYQFFTEKNGKNILTTVLAHISGEWVSSSLSLPGATDPQHFGSILTYYRRYALQSIIGVMAEEDDDGRLGSDGKQAQGSQKPQGNTNQQGGGGRPQGKQVATPGPKQKPQTFKEFLTAFGWTEDQAQEWVTLTYGLQPGEKSKPEMIEALKEQVKISDPKSAIFMARNP